MKGENNASLGYQRSFDVLIAGAGPAGSMSAVGLARAGLSVLLVDRARFPRDKVCGCCLNLAAFETLRQAGLAAIFERFAARRLVDMEIVGFGRRLLFPLPGGYVISRAAFDSALAESARQEGAHFVSGSPARLQSIREQDCLVELYSRDSGHRIVRASVVVCADGLNGSFLSRSSRFARVVDKTSRIGLSCISHESQYDLPDGRIRMAVSSKGYVGIVQLEDGRLNVAAAVDRDAVTGFDSSPAKAIERVLTQAGAPIPTELARQSWKGTPPLTRHRHTLGDKRLFILGDAASYVEPFTGEGIAWALMSGSLIVPLVLKAVQGEDRGLAAQWQQLYRKQILRRQLFCRGLRMIVGHPFLCRQSLALASLTSPFVKTALALLNRPLRIGI